MADRKCGNCKHFSSCSGVNADDVPENMMCNDFEVAPAAGGKDIGEKAEGSGATTAETKAAPKAGETTTTTRRKSMPSEAGTKEVLPPVDDEPGMPPVDDEPGMPPAEDSAEAPGAPEAHDEIDNDWDVFGSKVMSRYVSSKAARLVAEAEKAGIAHDGMKPSEMHEALLHWKAEQDEQAADDQPFDDELRPEPASVLVPEEESKKDIERCAVAFSQGEIERQRKVAAAEMAYGRPVGASSAVSTCNPLARHALIGMKAELEKQIVVLQQQVVVLDLVIESM